MIPDKTVGWEPAEPNACGHCGKTAPCECDNNRDGRNKKLGYLYPSSSRYCITDQNLAWMEYRCIVEDQGIRKTVKLSYYLHEPSWYWDHL